MASARVIFLACAALMLRVGMAKKDGRPFITFQECPLECECSEYTVVCRGLTVFPAVIPKNTELFKIADSSIDVVSANAFNSLSFIKNIDFTNSSIDSIHACAFSEMTNLDVVQFRNIRIKEIQPNAFSNIDKTQKIGFTGCHIDTMQSYSFHNISDVGTIEFDSTVITVAHPMAVVKLQDIAALVIKDCTFDRFLRDGFSKFTNVSVTMESVTISEWQCGTLETIMKAGDHVISDVSIVCNCSHSWIWRHRAVSAVLQNDWIRCIGDNVSVRQVANGSLSCPRTGRMDTGCPHMFPSTPRFCERNFDGDFEPVEKVAYPTYFTRNPPPNQGSELRVSPIMVFTLYSLHSHL